MSRQGAITFKGTPLTLVGQALQVGQAAPDFQLHRFADGAMQAVTLKDLLGKPTIISVVPSLDTGVCQIQTKKFNEQLASLGGRVNSVTVSLDLPFAQNRFCGAEHITNMMTLSDYQQRRFGQDWGMMIDELKILARGVFVLDANGKIVYSELVPEVTQEPNYDAAMAALKRLAG
jgi:thiol peroxidase